MNMKKIFKYIAFILPLISILIGTGCKSEFEVVLPKDGFNDSTAAAKKPKVLYLIVDGARGWAVRDAQVPTIKSLLPNSTYTWYSIADEQAVGATGWADLMTGVTKTKHQVVNAEFTGAQLQDYPNLAQRIKANLPGYRVASYSASEMFKIHLTSGADVSQAFATDAEVKSSIVTELNNDDASVIIGQFSSVNTAGSQFGYTLDAAEYKNAIMQFDQYLLEMMNALKNRKNYSKENWLVVLTSNRGGEATIPVAENDNTIMSDPKRNTFTILHTPSYKQRLIARPFAGTRYTGSFLRLYSSTAANSAQPLVLRVPSVYARVVNNNDVYNFGDTTSFTIELKAKKRPNPGLSNGLRYEWPFFLTKKLPPVAPNTARNGAGWGFMWEIDKWRFHATSKNNVQFTKDGPNVLDQNWHSLAVVVDSRRTVQTYHDGVPQGNPVALPAGFGGFVTTAPLVLGYFMSDNRHMFDGYVSDIRIFKAALSDDVIKQYSCDTRITPSHPFWAKLIGYWPGTDGTGTVIRDESQANNDFIVTVDAGTTLQWTNLSDIICPPVSSDLSQGVPKTYDLPRQIYSWLAMPMPETWQLDGRVWFNQ